tara:strand:+ start:167 stop:487 length:321 start_codon:yes stop_codon:yes gene_type:complete
MLFEPSDRNYSEIITINSTIINPIEKKMLVGDTIKEEEVLYTSKYRTGYHEGLTLLHLLTPTLFAILFLLFVHVPSSLCNHKNGYHSKTNTLLIKHTNEDFDWIFN